jgi:uncharacterized protein (DUF58 family)
MLRRLEALLTAGLLGIAAFSTGLPFLFYLLYLGLLVVGGSYLLTRLSLSDLEAGYAVDRAAAHVGDQLRISYTVHNLSRLPKLWLEVHNGTTLPGGLPGRLLTLGPRGRKSWQIRIPLRRRGQYRIEPLSLRTGDPFGLFAAQALVGEALTVVVYPQVEPLPGWRVPAANLEGAHAVPERTLQATPLASTVRPWAPGDAFNRIHWKSTARYGEIQVKEFELEQTSDVWVFLDLERAVHWGSGDDASLEVAVRVVASIADKALGEGRSLGLTTGGAHLGVLPADRGPRQHLKVMQLLAAVEADGETPFVEVLVQGLHRLRRGMTALVVTPSLDPHWVRPLSSLRGRGIGCLAVVVQAPHETGDEDAGRRWRALRHALAEHDLPVSVVRPGIPLGEQLR